MATFDDFVDAVKVGAKDLAKETFDGFQNEAENDAQAFIDKSKEDLERWVRALADGELTEQDFRDLLDAKKALAEIHALRQAGVAQTQLERFRTGLIDLAVDSAIDTFL